MSVSVRILNAEARQLTAAWVVAAEHAPAVGPADASMTRRRVAHAVRDRDT